MKLHRFIGEFDVSGENTEITNLDNIKQIKGVLRLDVGDFLVLCDGKGREAKVEITEIEKTHITTKILEKTTKENNSKKVSLYLTILKKENFELAIQKVVEIGVTEIIPVITERTIKTGLNIDRLNKIIREASEQSGRTILPTLYPTLKFEDAIKHIGNSYGVIFDLNGTQYERKKDEKDFSIFIGPEGGFTEKEIMKAKDAGLFVFLLGENTLRAETAAIVATYKSVNNL